MGNQESRLLSGQSSSRNSGQSQQNANSQIQGNKKDEILSLLASMQLHQTQINNLNQQSSKYQNYESCCNKIEGQVLFICLDCTINKQYGQCEECFINSNHLNHRYFLVKSSFETFCACGTNRNGQSSYSCKHHSLKKVINDSIEGHQLYLSSLDHILLSKIDSYFQNQIMQIQTNNLKNIQSLEKVVLEISTFCNYGFLAQVIIAEMLSNKFRNVSYLEKIANLLKQFSIQYQDATMQTATTIITKMNKVMSQITFHKLFEEEKAKFTIITYDIKVIQGNESIRYGLYNFYTRGSFLIFFSNNEFINIRRKEIINCMEQFLNENVTISDAVEQLNRFQSCLFHLNPRNKFEFENIDEIWGGLSRIFEAFFYSRSHPFKNEKEIVLHMHSDLNSLSFFYYFLNHIQFIKDQNRREKFEAEIFKFLVIQCRKRMDSEHNGYAYLAQEISQLELWPIFSLPYRFMTVYLCYLYYKCNGNIFEFKGLIENYSKQCQPGALELVLCRMSKEFATCYLFFKNRHVEPDSVAEFFEMVIRKEKSYTRICYDISLEYRKPTFGLHDIDITGMQMSILLSQDKKKVLEFIGQGMALQNIFNQSLRNQELNSIEQYQQKSLLLREVVYFELILIINSDVLSFANVLFNIFGDKAKKYYKLPFQLAIINQFNAQTVYKIPQLKDKLEIELNPECDNFKEIMQDICIYDPSEQHFKIKPQFKNFHDVQMFYKNSKRQGEFYSIIRERAEKENVFDCIAGNIFDLQEQIYNTNNQNIAFNQCISLDILEIESLPQIISNRMKELNITNQIDHNFMKHFCRLIFILLKYSTGNNFDALVKDKELVNFIKKSETDTELKNCIVKLLEIINTKRNRMNMSIMFPQQNQQANNQNIDQLIKSDRAKDAQRRVMEEFQNKQQGFLVRNKEMYQNEAEKQAKGEKILNCQICQQQTSELIVIYCYLDLDNLCQLYDVATNLNKVNFSEEFLTKNNELLNGVPSPQNLSRDSQNFERRCTLSSCMHSFHGKCFTTQVNSMPNTLPKRVINPNPDMVVKEMFCSQCKTLSNTALIYLDPIFKKIQFSKNSPQIPSSENQLGSLDQIQKSISISETSSSCHTSLKKEYNEQEYFDYITLYVVDMEDNIKSRKKNIEQFLVDFKVNDAKFIENLKQAITIFIEKFFSLSILICNEDIQTILTQAYQYQLDLAFSNGISEFLSKNIIISQAILQNLSLVQCIHDADFSIYTKAQERILLHLNKFHSFSFVLSQKLLKQNFSFDDIWRQVAADLYLIYNNDQYRLKQLIRAFALLYLQYIQIFYAFLLAKQREFPQLTIEKLKDMYQEDLEFRLSCQIFSLPYLRLVMATFITIFEFNEEVISNNLTKKYIDEEKELEVYEDILGKDFTNINFESIMKNTNSQNFWQLYMNDLNNLNNTQKLQPFLEKNPCFKFSFVYLGENYMQFHRFHYKPCCLCNRYSPKTKLVLCLICGQAMCVVDCDLKQDSIPEQGNLSIHSLSYHEGKTIFLSLQNQEIIFIDYPKGVAQKTPIFLDEIGQPIDLAINEDWERFTINKKKLDNLRQILFNRKLPQHIRQILWYEDPNIKCIDQKY
ncbi:hypothetical protein ABPG72_013031 [Tetrahymena utriculariae]